MKIGNYSPKSGSLSESIQEHILGLAGALKRNELRASAKKVHYCFLKLAPLLVGLLALTSFASSSTLMPLGLIAGVGLTLANDKNKPAWNELKRNLIQDPCDAAYAALAGLVTYPLPTHAIFGGALLGHLTYRLLIQPNAKKSAFGFNLF